MTEATDTLRAAQDADALQNTAGFRVRHDLRMVHVRGDDRVTWLNGQITSDVRKIPEGGSVHALAVNVRGKIMAELWVVDRGDELAILLPVNAQAAVLESFERYIIMEDVTLEADATARVISVQGPNAQAFVSSLALERGQAFSCDELGMGGVFIVLEESKTPALLQKMIENGNTRGVRKVSSEGFELNRLQHARPLYGTDFDERFYPQEAGLKALLSFNKGCYLGQEVVCTLENRGRMHRHLCALHADAGDVPQTGATVSTQTGETCGEITSATRDPRTGALYALGYVKHAHANAGEKLMCNAMPFTVHTIVGESA